MVELTKDLILEHAEEKNFEKIFELRIHNVHLEYINNLNLIRRCRILDLSRNSLAISPKLNDLPELRELNLSSNFLDEVPRVGVLKNLQNLYLNNNLIAKIGHLESSKKLQRLEIETNRLTSLKGVEALTDLKYLSVENNEISDVTTLKSLRSLVEVRMGENDIPQILKSAFDRSNVVEEFYVSSNELVDLGFLLCCNSLKVLNVSTNDIDVESFPPLLSLEDLNIADCGIQTLGEDFSEKLPSLTWLNAADNELLLLDIIQLGNLKKLTELRLDNNPVTKLDSFREDVLKYIPYLEMLGDEQVNKLGTKYKTIDFATWGSRLDDEDDDGANKQNKIIPLMHARLDSRAKEVEAKKLMDPDLTTDPTQFLDNFRQKVVDYRVQFRKLMNKIRSDNRDLFDDVKNNSKSKNWGIISEDDEFNLTRDSFFNEIEPPKNRQSHSETRSQASFSSETATSADKNKHFSIRRVNSARSSSATSVRSSLKSPKNIKETAALTEKSLNEFLSKSQQLDISQSSTPVMRKTTMSFRSQQGSVGGRPPLKRSNSRDSRSTSGSGVGGMSLKELMADDPKKRANKVYRRSGSLSRTSGGRNGDNPWIAAGVASLDERPSSKNRKRLLEAQKFSSENAES